MKKIFLKIVLMMAALFSGGGIVVASDLPDCPSSGYFHNCFGAYTYSNGSKYVGDWMNNDWHGQGTRTWANDDKYIGEHKDGKANGQGAYTYANGDKYVGENKDDKANGEGTFTYANGDKYVGMFKDDKRHGQGTLTWADGTVQEGIWNEGEFQYAQKLPANSSSSGNSKLDNHKEFCAEIGFTPGTEKFGDCVMKMMDKD